MSEEENTPEVVEEAVDAVEEAEVVEAPIAEEEGATE